MKICAAQARPVTGDIQQNIENHKKLISLALLQKADCIIFPELSLTGYEPGLAKQLACSPDDASFNDLQTISDQAQIKIGAGMPIQSEAGVLISMLIFQPGRPRQIYSKQFLHADEYPYFTPGHEQLFLYDNDNKIALAICYESLLMQHSENAFQNHATLYMASVAKSANGIDKAAVHFPAIARKFNMPVLMSNAVGHCDNFDCAGMTSAWNTQGILTAQLDDTHEGLLVFDTATGHSSGKII